MRGDAPATVSPWRDPAVVVPEPGCVVVCWWALPHHATLGVQRFAFMGEDGAWRLFDTAGDLTETVTPTRWAAPYPPPMVAKEGPCAS